MSKIKQLGKVKLKKPSDSIRFKAETKKGHLILEKKENIEGILLALIAPNGPIGTNQAISHTNSLIELSFLPGEMYQLSFSKGSVQKRVNDGYEEADGELIASIYWEEA